MAIDVKLLAKRVGFGLFLLLLMAVVVVTLGPVYERWRADQLLVLFHQTTVGVTTEAEFRTAANKHLKMVDLISEQDFKDPSHVTLYQFVSNAIGLDLLTHWTMLTVQIEFRDGVVAEKSAMLMVGNGPEYAANVSERVPKYWSHNGVEIAGHPHHQVDAREVEGGNSPWYRIFIQDDTNATEAEKKADWDINLACMTKFGGCHDSRELFPEARRTQPPFESPDTP
jgi:hypothetical protein